MTKSKAARVSSAKSKKEADSKKTAEMKKATASKPKTHPPTSEMVIAAITTLKERKGSSLQAIKKYIASIYKVDMKKQSFYIKKYLKTAVENNTLVQAKGNGASGRFKLALAVKGKNEKVVKKESKVPMKKKEEVKTAAKKPAAKKAAGEKKAPMKKQTTAKKTTAKATKLKSPTARKTKKASPSPAKPKYKKSTLGKVKPTKN